jgi:hypothetical protein
MKTCRDIDWCVVDAKWLADLQLSTDSTPSLIILEFVLKTSSGPRYIVSYCPTLSTAKLMSQASQDWHLCFARHVYIDDIEHITP